MEYGWDLVKWLERRIVYVNVRVLGSIQCFGSGSAMNWPPGPESGSKSSELRIRSGFLLFIKDLTKD